MLEVAEAPPNPRSDGSYQNDDQVKARLLAKLRERFLLESPEIPVVDAVFDDLELVLGEHADLTMADIEELTPRMHAVFRRVIYVARQPNSGVLPATVGAYQDLLIARFPRDFAQALAHLRRLAMAVSDSLDELLEELL
ncbi:DUF6415 family natural product biosynthesis protein [Streptomyces sp. H39-C1]|uniref:DUF6415 family natural product biosynthesis protein n=1 Tax=Streptomyces sp. H39-C1 TaxID=3004355 RepID=UPI0022AF7FD2|nr:DUF6415 family natural product biosynthesis protein [Streptomyces sp. H39-C1]MCZ4098287.1 DUF6415 family natural product biosynthesis protein [Streptomyces sp. H39-C1]